MCKHLLYHPVPPQDDSLEPQPGARLTAIVDDRGALVERQTLVMAERTLLCEVGMLFLWNLGRSGASCRDVPGGSPVNAQVLTS